MTSARSFVLSLSLVLLLCLAQVHSHVQVDDHDHDQDYVQVDEQSHDHGHMRCGHGQFEYEPELMDASETPLPGQEEGRMLQAGRNMRIFADYSTLTAGTAQLTNYIRNILMPAAISFVEGALTVRQPLNTPLRLAANNRLCNAMAVPQTLVNGVNADLFLAISTVTDQAGGFSAFAQACNRAASGRATTGRVVFNTVFTRVPPNLQDISHENNIYTALHELWHVLGHSNSMYPHFIDLQGRRRTNHISTLTQNGRTYTVLNVEPLTSALRNHFGCQTLRGAIMENDGGPGTAGHHFEKRFFLYDFMTGMSMTGNRVSRFSLNLLEGSGWYIPNYAFAEPFHFGQGQGCRFLTEDCSTATRNFWEFCGATNQRGCTAAGRGAGVCQPHPFSDGCMVQMPFDQFDCENPGAAGNARLPNHETYGPGRQSRCFSGTLATRGAGAQNGFCFTFQCNGQGLQTTVTVFVGRNSVLCNAAGPRNVPGLTGVINCPDPLSFCSMEGRQFCPRNCMGRGRCVNNRCACNPGFTGVDCSGR